MSDALITVGLLISWLGYGPVLNWVEDKMKVNR